MVLKDLPESNQSCSGPSPSWRVTATVSDSYTPSRERRRPLRQQCRFRHLSRRLHYSLQTTGELCVIFITHRGKNDDKSDAKDLFLPFRNTLRAGRAQLTGIFQHRGGELQSCTLALPGTSLKWDFNGVGDTSEQAR